ncbi:MAG: hypothetical protein ACE5GJ_07465 [Gemmatimonadota bacterium]
MAGYNVRSLRRPPPHLPPERAEATAQVTTVIAAQIIEAHVREHGRPPASLAEVGLDPGQFAYRVTPDGSYELVSRVDGAAARFDSREGPAAILRELGAPLPEPPGNPGR